ncbi:hypothetical protein FIV42_15710 [Persicimonas caeni]|uniref:PD-(D/E)XK nuclease-like domain-containing protein n=1 Tax=Persicimonas caeni TaxID=2292766 RepID=A0A4Y6PUX5_PERCE|nr:hypothetical protein [Persicimonas caeni]QDG52136.1 hypothetical protein FIV42_15710 [Persicimonas caeni]QED33358.1 hypothetical protein FRD00_15705 [Persicimonas caeni]
MTFDALLERYHALENVDARSFQPRIFNNLLSSQPLCFNLFGELQQNLELATEVFRTLAEGRMNDAARASMPLERTGR